MVRSRVQVNRRRGENFNSLFYRFNKKMKQSGLFKELKKRRFHDRPQNKIKRRQAALYRVQKQQEIKKMRRYAHGPFGRGN